MYRRRLCLNFFSEECMEFNFGDTFGCWTLNKIKENDGCTAHTHSQTHEIRRKIKTNELNRGARKKT